MMDALLQIEMKYRGLMRLTVGDTVFCDTHNVLFNISTQLPKAQIIYIRNMAHRLDLVTVVLP